MSNRTRALVPIGAKSVSTQLAIAFQQLRTNGVPERLWRSSPLLEGYRALWSEKTDRDLFDEFSESLCDMAENTRYAYITDVGAFLIIKLLSFFDFPIKFNRLAAQLMLLQTIDGTEQQLVRRKISLDTAETRLHEAVGRLGDFSPPKSSRIEIAPPEWLSAACGNKPRIQVHDGRLMMVLRQPRTRFHGGTKYMAIRYQDRLMLEIIMRTWRDALNQRFWDEIFCPRSRNQILDSYRHASSNTLARKYAALSRFTSFLSDSERLSVALHSSLELARRPRWSYPPQVSLEQEELRCMLQHFDRQAEEAKRLSELSPASSRLKAELLHFRAVRNRTMFSLLVSTAARGSAIVTLTMDQIQTTKGGYTLHLREKGGKHPLIPLIPRAVEALREYLDLRARLFKRHPSRFGRAVKGKYVFVSRSGERIGCKALSTMIDSASKLAGITKSVSGRTRVTAHSIRRSISRGFQRGGTSRESIRIILGHNSERTTQKYLERITGDLELAEIMREHPATNL